MSISAQLRETIEKSGLSLRQIARETGVTQPALSHFMSGDPDRNDIRLVRTADKLAEFFGLELTPKSGTTSRSAKVVRVPKTKAGRPRGSKKAGEQLPRLRRKLP
jgi:transcriptional regulator with XRE-family HTH domain